MRYRILIALLIFGITPLLAQNELSKVATGMGQFLKLGAGARGTALGDAYSAISTDVSALYWNPAGIQKTGHPAIAVARTALFAGITYDFFGVVYPIDAQTTTGFSVLYLNSGDMELTTIENPEGSGQTFDAASYAFGFSVARRLTDRFDLGITVKIITERLWREKASALAFDVGSQFDTGIYGMKLGMSLTNFGGKMKLDGPDLNDNFMNKSTGAGYEGGVRYKTEEWPIPLIFRLGFAVDLLGAKSDLIRNEMNRLTLCLEGNDPVDHYLRYNMGLEYEWIEMFALRAGYKNNYDEADFTAGFGFDFNKIGLNARLDYALNNYGILGYVHNYSLQFMF
jgi:hypothetical protein